MSDIIILGLGSNQGDRREHLQQAVTMLGRILSEIYCSPVYESQALLPEGAPPGWNIPFFNMAVRGLTKLAPPALLSEVKNIERSVGRVTRGHWGPREIDIDILAYGDRVVNETNLVIPHPALLERDFALIPFADIAPGWIYPLADEYYGRSARELALRLTSSLVKTDIIIA